VTAAYDITKPNRAAMLAEARAQGWPRLRRLKLGPGVTAWHLFAEQFPDEQIALARAELAKGVQS
jgi:hypothetical protein